MRLATPKGFRDFLPAEAVGRRVVLQKIISVFERFGFDPLETPTLEYAETLKGKYGEEEKLIYEFETRGGDQVALRYDQTVPTSRVAAQYPELPKPFKRYQIQSAYRGENTQKGRYREFLQCDADIIGLSTPLADAEILSLVFSVYEELGLEIIIKVNDRTNFNNLIKRQVFSEKELLPILRSLDKIEKVGREAVLDELAKKGFATERATYIIQEIENLPLTSELERVFELFKSLTRSPEALSFSPTLARGLDYYTGLIFEIVLKNNSTSSSLCGGGRYDKLIGLFTGQDQPATGFAIGFDRTLEAMAEAGTLPNLNTNTQVLVTVFSPNLLEKSLAVTTQLRLERINTEVWLDPEAKLEKQLRYADNKGIPYVVIIGPDEASKGLVTLKNLVAKTQTTLSLDKILMSLEQLPSLLA